MKVKLLLVMVLVLGMFFSLGSVSSACDPSTGIPGTASITVTKVDGATGAPIAGWLIRVYSLTPTFALVAEGRTGADGTVTFSGLPVGSCGSLYKVWEEARPCWEPLDKSGLTFWNGGWDLMKWLNKDDHAQFQFSNVYTCPGTQGCTPGYWKQDQHFDSWVGYSPSGSFQTAFGGLGPNITLLAAMQTKGGGEGALLRHAAAALLNASSGIDYGYSVADVIVMVTQAYSSGDFETVKNQFEIENELYCPLN